MTSFCPKLKLEDPKYLTSWNHRGGWGTVLKNLESLTTPQGDGTLCISALEEVANRGETITEPWVGFIHHVPCSNLLHYNDTERLLKAPNIVNSLPHCKGIFVISRYVQEYLRKQLPSLPVARVLYPLTPFPQEKIFHWSCFTQQRKVLNVGTFLRNYQAFYDLDVPNNTQKILLKPPDVDFNDLYDLNKTKVTLKTNDSVQLIDRRLSDEEYDNVLSNSIIFLNLYDATINTTVIECIGRNTPLIVNRLPGLEEYLGEAYPLFYDTLKEASEIIADDTRLLNGIQYLKSLEIKTKLTQEYFLTSLTKTAIYRSLPTPLQYTHTDHYDVTVFVFSHRNTISNLLLSFTKQDYNGSFEIIVWNDNRETHQEYASIVEPYKKSLDIRLFQSSDNLLCDVKLVASRLMRSNYLLICDENVIPLPNFITTFINNYKQYGPNTVGYVCGNTVAVDKENIKEFQENRLTKEFIDEYQPDRQVDIMDTTVSFIPKKLLLQMSTYHPPPLTSYLTPFNDDWLSYVLSIKPKVQVWKLQGSDIFYHQPALIDYDKASTAKHASNNPKWLKTTHTLQSLQQ